MRTIGVLTVITLFFIWAAIGAQGYLQTSARELIGDLEQTEEAVRHGEWDEADRLVNDLDTRWRRVRDIWNLFTEHEEIDSINGSLARLIGYIKEKEKPSAIAEGEAVLQLFQHVPEKERLNLINVL